MLALITSFSFGQISITSAGTAFIEDFNTLANTGTSSTTPSGWAFFETGSGANTTYLADNGGANGGNTYSYGATSNTDRALGTLISGSVTSSIGASYINNTGAPIAELTISYTGEQWRLGTAGRQDRLDFFYSTTATALNTGAYTAVTNLNFTAPITSGTLGAFDGNLPANRTAVSFTITGLNIPNGSTFWIKWADFNATSADDGLAIDDFSITAIAGGADITAPIVTTLTPLDNATNVLTNASLQILFNEAIAKGTGNIVIKKLLDNTVHQTIDVTTAAVTVAGSTATISITPAFLNTTDYYVEIDAGAFTDIALNNFAGITGNSTWNFTTISPPAAGVINNNYGFTNCASTFLAEGWSQYSVAGTQTWTCSTTGRTDANGMQINAFVASGNNPLNEDWLVSPIFDLSAVSLPTLKFYSRGDFIGNSLQLKISNNYTPGTNPTGATWTNLTGNFPTNVAGQGVWTLSDNIDLSSYNSSNITIAWVYANPTIASSSRWTIDDVIIYPQIVLQPCAELTDQPTNLVLTATAATVSGTFDLIPNPTTVQNYLVVRSLTTPLTQLPVDGVNYTAGQVIGGGNGSVFGISSDGTFTDNTVSPSTQYYYFVFAIEDQNCIGGPNYNQLLPLTQTATTPALAPCTTPTEPTALILTAANTTISGTFTASGASAYLVIKSTVPPALGASPVDGTTYTIGQAFGNGNVISISTSNTFTATGLTVATPYYFYVFALNNACTGTPFYSVANLPGTISTTNVATGIPTGYYDAASTLTCQPLKTALKNIITTGSNVLGYTPGIWNIIQYADMHRNDANTADIIWDMYSDNPTGPEPYTFTYGSSQCGTYTNEGGCYNREHSTPQSWFGSIAPMVSDAHHIFATDGKVNGMRSNYPYGEVSSATFTSMNGGKLGTGNNFGYTGTVFEPINEYKGDFARACLYMITRYENEVISQNWSNQGTGNTVFLSPTDEPDAAKRQLQMYDLYYLKTLIKWHNQDPVSQKEIDRNNAIYYTAVNSTPIAQHNRNPFVDHPEYVAQIWSNACGLAVPISLIEFKTNLYDATVKINWTVDNAINFSHFILERSTDGILFKKIATVSITNTKTYNYLDVNTPKVAVIYYRLKMIDTDGKFSYSKIEAVKLNIKTSAISISPNPTTDYLNIKLDKQYYTNSTLTINDIAGRRILQQNVPANTTTININIKNIGAGKYFVKLITNNEIVNNSFIIVK